MPEKRPRLFLVLFTLVYAFGVVCSSSRRGFFIDEIITSYLADLPRIGQIWPLIGQGIELNPPLPFWIAWLVHHTLGGNEILSRLPALAGFWLMCFCLYLFVRRRCGVTFGFVALLLPLFTYPAWEATIARGYGLMLGMSALALLSWQVAADNVRRPLALAGLAIGIAGAVSCHYYAVYVAGAIALGEIVRRKFDPAIWIALLAGLSPFAIYAQLLRSAAAGASSNFWVSPMPRFLYESYADLLGPTTMVFLLLLGALLWRGSENIRWAPPVAHRHEVVACLVLIAMPLAVYLGAVFGALPFFSRYVQPVTIGFTAVFAMFAHRIGGNSDRFRNLLIGMLVWVCLLPWGLWQGFKAIAAPSPHDFSAMRKKLPADLSLPVVFDSELDFIEFYHYAPPDIRAKIYNLVNREAGIRFRGSDTAQKSIALAQTFRELHTVDYHRFLAEHREFLVVRLRQEGWVVQSLLGDQAKVRIVSLDKDPGFFVTGRSVYHVVVSGR